MAAKQLEVSDELLLKELKRFLKES
jgi:hypothetical protein